MKPVAKPPVIIDNEPTAILNDPWIVDLKAQIRVEHEAAIGSFRSGFEHAVKCGELLLEAKGVAGHGNWSKWLSSMPFAETTARGYMRMAEAWPSMPDENRQRVADLPWREALKLIAQPKDDEATTAPTPAATRPAAEDKDALLLRLQDENAALRTIVERSEVEPARVVGGSPLTLQSKSVEHYTPARYVDAARAVLGSIDLDPASCEIANATVKASKFYTAVDDGLQQQWSGRVWLNPPYCRQAGDFVAKLAEEYQAGNVTAAVVLVNAHATDTDWFQPLWGGHICFTDHRINFYGDNDRGSPTHGSAIVYFGKEPDKFIEVFDEFGPVVVRTRGAA